MGENDELYWLYTIKSEFSGRIYLGQTGGLKDRLKRHNYGEVKSTKAERPWKLIADQPFESRSQVLWKEGELKRSREKRLRWLNAYRNDHFGIPA
ncbi:MAG: GIY-YIG nuclease family protein, partial [Desulfobacteraceae bacterium]|nr:GIY-YIG nuclease family protein [Desulfobacteraceae bacterium]